MHVKTSLTVVGVVAMLLTLSACAKSQTVGGSGGLSGQAPSPAPTVAVVPSGSTTSSATATATATSTATATATHTKAAGPRINTFVVVQQPDCPIIGSTAAVFSKPGTDIIVKWSVSGGATGVALSLDDPNHYKNTGYGSIGEYSASGTETLPFVCDPTVQPDTVHKYTLNTIGGGPSISQTLTITKQTSP